MGCGRKVDKDKLDYTAGIEFLKKTGDRVTRGDAIYRIFGENTNKLNNAKKILDKTYILTKVAVPRPKLIIN